MRNLIKQFDHFKATSKKGGKVQFLSYNYYNSIIIE